MIISDNNPTINTNPYITLEWWVNRVSGELFICRDNARDANIWVGQMGTIVAPE